jgi:predicted nucleotidyltransferase
MPSAHEIGPNGWLKYKKKKNFTPNYHTISADEQKKIIQKVSQAAKLLKKDFGATRVFVFGSLLDQTRYTKDSDIDIAVEGIAHEDYWKAWRIVDNFLADQCVDFIDINDLDDIFRNNIIHQGVSV